MRLRTLLSDLPDARLVRGARDPQVESIAYDSRNVQPGGLFVAIPGFETDGHRFIPEALSRGAIALVVQDDRQVAWEPVVASCDATVVAVTNTRAALAGLAAAFYRHPARRMRMVGVTGTKGKSTTSYLIEALLRRAGRKTGLISSVEFKVGDEFLANSTQATTPESLEVQELLAKMRDAGSEDAVIESTSHGLALHRLDHLDFDVAAFTNLYPDHLDFHPSMEDYLEAKGRLFEMLDESVDKGIEKTAVLNADDPASVTLRGRTQARILAYGVEASDADIRADDIQLSERGSHFRLSTPAGEIDAQTPLLGLFSVYNCLAATGVGLCLGVGLQTIGDTFAAFSGVPGRLERIDAGQPFAVVVDFAHTGEALHSVLQALKRATSGRLIAVFGAGGDRDPARRTGMGQAAGELADFAVICNDNPRTENPASIISQIADAMVAAGRTEGEDFMRIPDRREAIHHAFARAQDGDVVILAGKGHEPYVIVGHEYLPWDDRQVAREELAKLELPARDPELTS